MGVLFLDDAIGRRDSFQEYYGKKVDLDIVTTAKDAIDFIILSLLGDGYDTIFLDHDLGGEVYVDSDREDCGMEVVRWIIKNRPKIGNIIIHSWNIPAGISMHRKLRDAGYRVQRIPFGRNLFT